VFFRENLWLLLIFAEFIRVFFYQPTQLYECLEVAPRSRKLFGVDSVRVLDRRISDETADLVAEFY
jgi:hypothetical protein